MPIHPPIRPWIILSATALGVFFAALVAGSMSSGLATQTGPNQTDEARIPGIYPSGDDHYDVYIVVSYRRGWRFDAGQTEMIGDQYPILRFPAGAEVTFYIASQGVTHGFLIEEHDAALDIFPGQLAHVTVNFDQPGTFRVLSQGACQSGHEGMWAQIVVEPDT